jgi:hypothetical protein
MARNLGASLIIEPDEDDARFVVGGVPDHSGHQDSAFNPDTIGISEDVRLAEPALT